MSNLPQRFWDKVNKTDGCWLWTAGKFHYGHGQFWLNESRPNERAHRLAWEDRNGPIPEGLCVCHKCDTPACVNPDHLFLGTQGDNNADRNAKGRTCIGTRHPSSKLTEDAVRKIHSLREARLSQRRISKAVGVSQTLVWRVLSGRSWGQVEVA